MESNEQIVVLHPGDKNEVTLRITHEGTQGLVVRADLSRAASAEGESRIDREKYRLFSSVVHSAVYAAPKNGMRMKPAYALSTDDQTGQASCSIPTLNQAESEAIIANIAAAAVPVRASAMA